MTKSLSSWLKRPKPKANHTLPPSAEVKNEWRHTSTPSYAFTACTSTALFYKFTFHKQPNPSPKKLCGAEVNCCVRTSLLNTDTFVLLSATLLSRSWCHKTVCFQQNTVLLAIPLFASYEFFNDKRFMWR